MESQCNFLISPEICNLIFLKHLIHWIRVREGCSDKNYYIVFQPDKAEIDSVIQEFPLYDSVCAGWTQIASLSEFLLPPPTRWNLNISRRAMLKHQWCWTVYLSPCENGFVLLLKTCSLSHILAWAVTTEYHKLGHLNNGNLFSHTLGRWQVWDQGASRFGFYESSLPSLYMATLLLCPQMNFLLCAYTQRRRERENERVRKWE